VLDWDLCDALLAMVDRLKAQALVDWRHAELMWAIFAQVPGSKIDKPRKPEILG
jgi:hypothetical protein